MNYTCHSEVGKIKSIFIKHAQQAFISDSHLEENWQSLNYLGKPDMVDARREYNCFQSLIENHGVELHFFPAVYVDKFLHDVQKLLSVR